MRERGNRSGGIKPVMISLCFKVRYFLLVAATGLALLLVQTGSALAIGFSATSGSMVSFRQNHAATLLNDGRVLITGGTFNGTLTSAEIYDPATGNFIPTADMSLDRQGHTATRLADGRVLIAGGNGGSATAEIFDPAGNGGVGTFTPIASPMAVRSGHTATLISGNRVLITGGQNNSSTLQSAEIFDPSGNAGAGAFIATGNMSIARRLHTATLLADGRVLLAGGSITNSINSSSITSTAEIFDPAGNGGSGAFTAITAPMTSKRNSHTATLISGNKVLIAGGYFNGIYLATAEIFDPAGAGGAGTFTPTTGSMAGGHGSHTATLLNSGKVLIAGGWSGSLFTNPPTNALSKTGEIFNPAAGGSFTSAGTLASARAFHTGVPLNDGTILLAGGNDTTVISESAELYNPAGIAVTPASFTFDNIFLGDPQSPPQDFTISNTGSTGLTLNSIALSGQDSAMFTLALDTCGPLPKTLASGGGNCSVSVTFNPSSSGKKSASIVINSNDPEKPAVSIPLTNPGGFTVNPATSPTRLNSQTLTGIREIGTDITATCPTATVGPVTFPTDTTFAVTVTGLAEGNNTITFSAADSALNTVTIDVTIISDTIPPGDGTLSANPGTSQVSLSWSGFSDSGSGIGNYKLVFSLGGFPSPACVDGTAIYSGSATEFLHTGLANGASYNYRICAIDIAGNVSAGATATASPVAPTILLTVAAPTGGTVTGSGISCPGVCSESLPVGTQVTLTAAASPDYQFTGWSGACAGTNPVCTTAALIANASVTASFADSAPPVMTLSTLSNGVFTDNPTLNITGHVTDNDAVQSFTINGIPVALDAVGSFSHALKLAAGENIITSDAADPAGNRTTDVRTITLDATVPALTVAAPADNSTSNKTFVTVSGTIDPDSAVEIVVNNGTPQAAAVTGTGFTQDVNNLAPGLNTLEITATDLAGKKNTLKRSVVSNSQNPTIAVTDPNQDRVTTEAGMTIRGTIADALDPVTVSVTSGADTFTPVVSGGAFEQAVTFPEAGSYPLIIKVTDNTGTTTIQRNILHEPLNSINPVVTPTKLKTQAVTGIMEAGTTVAVTCATATVGTATYPTTTSWSVSLTGLAEGTNSITATFTNLQGTVTTAQTVIVVDSLPPVNGTLVAVAGINQVSLSWTGFSDPGIAGYQLVYATGVSPSSCSAGSPIYSGLNTSFVHTGLVKGTMYFYRLCAVDNLANTSSGATAKARLTLAPLVIGTASPLASGTYGVNYTKNVAATGGLKPYVWSVISGALPAGVTLNAVNGALRGKPSGWGDFSFTVQVVDKQQNTTTKDMTMTILVPQLVITPPTVTTTLMNGRTGIAFKKVQTAKGGVKPYAWSVLSGTLPDGLVLDAATGIISGKPTASGTYPFTIQLMDFRNVAVTKNYNLIVK